MRTKHHDKNRERAHILHSATNALEKLVIYVREGQILINFVEQSQSLSIK